MKGIYGIKVDNCLVYVGQATNINERIRQHWSAILEKQPRENKYQLLKSAASRKHKITFWLLEEVKEAGRLDDVERKWIKTIQPCLNTQHTKGIGHKLTANEFYQNVMNEAIEIEGATQWRYITIEEQLSKFHEYLKHKQNND